MRAVDKDKVHGIFVRREIKFRGVAPELGDFFCLWLVVEFTAELCFADKFFVAVFDF